MTVTPGSHGSSGRNSDLYQRKSFPDEGSEGRFGRLFAVGEGGKDVNGTAKLRPHTSPRYDLMRLGVAGGPLAATGAQDSAAPAGMTFLGQFVDHDLTLDVSSKFENPQINAGLENARTPNLDLDCVYGGGPEASPHLYDGPYLIEGEPTCPANSAETADLPRNSVGRAVIGDPRNDENVFVSQIQGAFIRFHNRCVDEISMQDKHLSGAALFEEARDTTIHYYHRVVLEDLLYHVIGVEMIHDISTHGRKFYFPLGFWDDNGAPEKPYIPVEFSVAAYRYGHSQIRDTYDLNDTVTGIPVFSQRDTPESNVNPPTLRGFQPLPENHQLDWDNFFPPPGQGKTRPAFKIDPFLPKPLLELPKGVVGESDPVTSLAARNLLRGRTFRLPSGETIAEHMACVGALVGHDPDRGRDLIVRLEDSDNVSNPAIKKLLELLKGDYAMTNTPLWLYVLIEAALFGIGFNPGGKGSGGGDRLGPVGGRIVGEVILGLLDHYRDMSGKGLDYEPRVGYNYSKTPNPSLVTIASTEVFGPRMSMNAFVQFAFAKPLCPRKQT